MKMEKEELKHTVIASREFVEKKKKEQGHLF